MNDEEMNQAQDPVIELPSEAEPDSAPTDSPMEVIPVDEFLDRLAELFDEGEEASESETPEDPEEAAEAIEAVDVDLPVPDVDPVVGLVEQVLETLIDLGKIENHLGKIEKDTNEIQLDVASIAQTVDHPALTTPFEDYTVTEALLLFLLLAAFMSACARMLRGGLKWLRS